MKRGNTNEKNFNKNHVNNFNGNNVFSSDLCA